MTKTIAQAVLPVATVRETLSVIGNVVLPNLAKGVIIRRPNMVALAERLNLDKRAVRQMQRLRDRYGTGPLLLRIPVHSYALVLDRAHVRRVLDGSPEPFATASSEKRAALSHFEPKSVLISHGAERADRRAFNEAVLDAGCPMHRLAEHFRMVVEEETALLLGAVRHREELAWDDFVLTWFRVVRRVVLGDTARDDHALTDMLARLRSDANWAFLHPKRTGLRHRFEERLAAHLVRAEPGSLASVIAATPTTSVTAPFGQVPQWLFAFDAAGIAFFRSLALLATHAAHQEQAHEEIARAVGSEQQELPYLRACVLEALRLWPTTPLILRETTKQVAWESGMLPAKTGVVIVAPFFHRDDTRLPEANRFAPELWLRGRTAEDWPLVPFSDGPAICPGRDLVLLMCSTFLATLLADRTVQLKPPTRLDPRRPLPATLNNYALRFKLDEGEASYKKLVSL